MSWLSRQVMTNDGRQAQLRWTTLKARRRRLNPPQAQQQATTHKVRIALLELCRCNVLAPICCIEDNGTIQWIRIVTTSCRQSNLTGPVVQLYSSVLALLRPYPPAPDLSGHAVLPISAVPVTRPVGPRPRPMLPRSAQLARCKQLPPDPCGLRVAVRRSRRIPARSCQLTVGGHANSPARRALRPAGRSSRHRSER